MDSVDCRPKQFYGCRRKGNRQPPFTGLGIKKVPSGSLGQVDFLAGQVTFFFSLPVQWTKFQVNHPQWRIQEEPLPPTHTLVCRPN